MTAEQKERVQEFFESKSYSSVKEDIDNYCSIISERQLPVMNVSKLNEKRKAAMLKTPSIEDAAPEFVTEKFKKVDESEDVDSFLSRANSYLMA